MVFLVAIEIMSLEKTIKKIINDYEKIQISINENKLYTFKDFEIQMNKVLNKKIDNSSQISNVI